MAINVTQGLINQPTERKASNQAVCGRRGRSHFPRQRRVWGGRKEAGDPFTPTLLARPVGSDTGPQDDQREEARAAFAGGLDQAVLYSPPQLTPEQEGVGFQPTFWPF
jgi:hypothetical protein